jgi:amidophosphoribosyltransferase
MSGIFGVVAKKECLDDLFYGTDYHSHLGTQFAGLAVYGKSLMRKIHDIKGSQFKAKFHEDYLKMPGDKGIGVISARDEQPIVMTSKFGPFAIVTNGFIENADKLSRELFKKGRSFSEIAEGKTNFTELAAKMIISGKDIVSGLEKMSAKIHGSASLLVLNKDGIYAVRDKLGLTPLVIGKRGKDWAVSTESSAFLNLGYKLVKYLGPGEIVLITKDGLRVKSPATRNNQICSFLWIYTGFPASSYENINVETSRERCGAQLAKDDNIRADIVAGIPDSGSAHAIGYSMHSGIPLRRPLVKYTPGFDRSYTPVSQSQRDLIAKMKLIPIPEIIKGKRIVFCDDSIVRGTQLKNFTIQKLKKHGAKEIHLRIACPPLMFPCKYNFSTRSIDELVARRAIKRLEGKEPKSLCKYLKESTPEYKRMVAWINKDLGSTTLKYQKLCDMIKAIGLPREQLCLYCWTGLAPKGRAKNVCKKG